MKNEILIGGFIAIIMFFIARLIANTGILGNGYYGTLMILVAFLIWTIITCTLAILNVIKTEK